jgi:hypothetical protein
MNPALQRRNEFYMAKEKSPPPTESSCTSEEDFYSRNGALLQGRSYDDKWYYTTDGSIMEANEDGTYTFFNQAHGNCTERNLNQDGIDRNTKLPPLPKNFRDLPRIDRQNIRLERKELKIQLEKK